jgi:hypothetical protein
MRGEVIGYMVLNEDEVSLSTGFGGAYVICDRSCCVTFLVSFTEVENLWLCEKHILSLIRFGVARVIAGL